MKKITYLLLITMSLFVFNSCEEDVVFTKNLNYVSFESSTFNFGVDIDGTTELPISIYSTQITSSDRTFTIKVNTELSTANPASYDIPTLITIPANKNEGILPVTISDMNIGIAGKKIILEFQNEEGISSGKPLQLDVVQSCPGNEVFVDLNFDNWGSETSWKLEDSSNSIVASGDSYSDGDSSFSTSFCLGAGTYAFTVYDSYGDGGCSVAITKNNETLVDISGGDFENSASATFEIN